VPSSLFSLVRFRCLAVEVETARLRQQGVKHPLLGVVAGEMAHLAGFDFARFLHRNLGQIADDRIDVATDIADFGELGGLDLDEGRIGKLCQTARDLGLADSGGTDHQDVFRRDFLTQRIRHLRAPPAIAQRDGDRALGGGLTDDMFVQLGNDFLGRHHWQRVSVWSEPAGIIPAIR